VDDRLSRAACDADLQGKTERRAGLRLPQIDFDLLCRGVVPPRR
jgi:hypothetical protein